jgi:NTE family protein
MTSPFGLVLSGGGARAAYQVGVLQALSDLQRSHAPHAGNPFDVICGTSAGAINAAALASSADDHHAGIQRLCDVWRHFHVEQVFRADIGSMLRGGARWVGAVSTGWLLGKGQPLRPRSMLNNSPLADLLASEVNLSRVPELIRAGKLRALAVTASSYTSGLHMTFYDSQETIAPWQRSQRRAVRCRITNSHLLASSAIPFVFPGVKLHVEGRDEFLGDGAMRQTAPLSPAIHLGAHRLLVIGAARLNEPDEGYATDDARDYPSLAQVAGHALSSIFLDALAVDIERAQRINNTLRHVPTETRAQLNLRPIDLMVIAPSERLDLMAARHLDALPWSARAMLRSLGASTNGDDGPRGLTLASYLLFESGYTQALMDLGYRDVMAQRDEVLTFTGWRLTGG